MIERSQEYRRILKLTDWELVVSPQVFYLIDTDDGRDVGLWGFHPHEGDLMVHAKMDREHRGAYAAESVRQAFAWIFQNTTTSAIVAAIPDESRHVHFMARHVGMALTGIDEAGFRCYRVENPNIEQRAA